MTSAFTKPEVSLALLRQGSSPASVSAQKRPVESETEDEEVKLTCALGVAGTSDDDMNTTTDLGGESETEDDSDEEEELSSLDSQLAGVVSFSSLLTRPAGHPRCIVVKPSASRCPPLQVVHEEDITPAEDCDQVSVGARGVALRLDESEDDEYDGDSDDHDDDSLLSETEDLSSSEDEAEEDSEDEEMGGDKDDHERTLEGPDLEQRQATSEDTEDSTSVILKVLEDVEDDEEISSLIDTYNRSSSSSSLDSLLLDESRRSSTTHLIGVVRDREEELETVPRTKRVMSLDETLLDSSRPLPPVKRRRKSDLDEVSCAIYSTVTHNISSSLPQSLLTLSIPEETALPMTDVITAHPWSPMTSNGSDGPVEEEEEGTNDDLLDGQLRCELESMSEASERTTSSPVPLLTPPSSPMSHEWPSNLAVDSALHISPRDVPTTISLGADVQITPRDLPATISLGDDEAKEWYGHSALLPLCGFS
jgi:hypothetical protein